MKISNKGKLELCSYEGVSTKPYLDDADVWTIGIGRTSYDGMKINAKTPEITIKQAIDLFVEDIKRYEDTVNKLVKVQLTQEQYDALVSFQYNTGGLARSTLLKLINNKSNDKDALASAFLLWSKVTQNGVKVVNKGLVNRRNKEINLFNNNLYSNDGKIDLISVDSNYKPHYNSRIDITKYFTDENQTHQQTQIEDVQQIPSIVENKETLKETPTNNISTVTLIANLIKIIINKLFNTNKA